MCTYKKVAALALFAIITATYATAQQEHHIKVEQIAPKLVNSSTWSVHFDAEKLNMSMTQQQTVRFTINHIDAAWGDDYELHVRALDDHLLRVAHIVYASEIPSGASNWTGNFSAEALLLGHTRIYVELRRTNLAPERSQQLLDVIIVRNLGFMDVVFQIFVGCFVMILYVNFGAVLDLQDLKRIVLCPIGPAIGFVGQFLIMPVLSFLIGYYLFHDNIELRLGLFFTGTTPGGGSSNIFTVILNGNLNLSITMTAISNLLAFGMMPLWIFTLGALIFQDGNFAIPYGTIAATSFSLVIPLSVGIALQYYAPDITKKMSKWLKPISLALIIIVTVFAFSVNSYMFKLFSYEILLGSSALPWIGYGIGWLMAIAFRQSPTDALTIAIETGIQNTGIAIFMLNFTLPQPQADMTSAVPVASSMMTPLPLLLIYLIRKCFYRTSIEEVEEAPNKTAKEIEVEAIMEKPMPANANTVFEKL